MPAPKNSATPPKTGAAPSTLSNVAFPAAGPAPSMPAAALLAGIAEGEEKALSTLFRLYGPVLLAVVEKGLGPGPAAEEVLFRLFLRLATLPLPAGGWAYLLSLTRYETLNRLRASALAQDGEGLSAFEDLDFLSPAGPPFFATEGAERAAGKPVGKAVTEAVSAESGADPLAAPDAAASCLRMRRAWTNLDPHKRGLLEAAFFRGTTLSALQREEGMEAEVLRKEIHQGLRELALGAGIPGPDGLGRPPADEAWGEDIACYLLGCLDGDRFQRFRDGFEAGPLPAAEARIPAAAAYFARARSLLLHLPLLLTPKVPPPALYERIRSALSAQAGAGRPWPRTAPESGEEAVPGLSLTRRLRRGFGSAPARRLSGFLGLLGFALVFCGLYLRERGRTQDLERRLREGEKGWGEKVEARDRLLKALASPQMRMAALTAPASGSAAGLSGEGAAASMAPASGGKAFGRIGWNALRREAVVQLGNLPPRPGRSYALWGHSEGETYLLRYLGGRPEDHLLFRAAFDPPERGFSGFSVTLESDTVAATGGRQGERRPAGSVVLRGSWAL